MVGSISWLCNGIEVSWVSSKSLSFRLIVSLVYYECRSGCARRELIEEHCGETSNPIIVLKLDFHISTAFSIRENGFVQVNYLLRALRYECRCMTNTNMCARAHWFNSAQRWPISVYIFARSQRDVESDFTSNLQNNHVCANYSEQSYKLISKLYLRSENDLCDAALYLLIEPF